MAIAAAAMAIAAAATRMTVMRLMHG
jgi:hypothetical protein